METLDLPTRKRMAMEDVECAVFEWRGRDIALVPPAALTALDDAALLGALFAPEDLSAASSLLIRDRKRTFLRLRPMDFARVRAALAAHGACPVRVAFKEYPLLPWQAKATFTARPYHDAAPMATLTSSHCCVLAPATMYG